MKKDHGSNHLSPASAFLGVALATSIVLAPPANAVELQSQAHGFCSTIHTRMVKATKMFDAAGFRAHDGFKAFRSAILSSFKYIESVEQANINALPKSTPQSVRRAAARELAVDQHVVQRIESATNAAQLNIEDIKYD